MVPTGNVTLWVRRASLHTFVIIFISLWYIILCIGLFLWWSQYFSLYSNKNQPLSVKSCRFFCAVWLNLYLSPLGNFLFRYSQNNFSRLLDVLFILRQSFLIMKLYKNIKSGPQTPVFSLYLRYNWNLFCYTFSFHEDPQLSPRRLVRRPCPCLWGSAICVCEVWMCMWSSFWSPGLFLLICLLRIITDCSFIKRSDVWLSDSAYAIKKFLGPYRINLSGSVKNPVEILIWPA